MSEANWEKERKELLERLQKAEQIAAESQSEAAVYWDLLVDWCEVAEKALASKNLSLLKKITDNLTIPFFIVDKKEGELWGRLFLQAYIRDARWLGHAKQALEKIKADAERLSVENNEVNAELKKSIIAAAELGLIEHV